MESKKLVKEFIKNNGFIDDGTYKVNVSELLREFIAFLKTKNYGKEEKSKT